MFAASAAAAATASSDHQLATMKKQLRGESGAEPRARASVPCGPLVAVCVRVAIGVATKVAAKIGSRGSNAVKDAARRQVRRRGGSFRRFQKSMRRTGREARKLRRSRAYRKRQWRKLARALRARIGPASRDCLFAGAGTLLGGGSVQAGIAACVAAFVNRISRSSSTALSSAYGHAGPSRPTGLPAPAG